LARLELEPGARILDLGCGEGMHVAEIACRGYDVVGVDLSPEMIRQARGEAEDRECDVELIERDMRELEFDGEFDAVLCWNAVFGYFSDEENRRAVRQMHRALKPGGRLLLDVVNRDYAIGQHPNFVWFEGDDCVCMEETGFNFIASRLQVSRTIILQNSQQLSQKYTLRLYSLHELGQLLHHQGFRVAEVSGQESAPGAFFGDVSPRMIVLAERRVASGEA
jgi:SAM-dependent methyltransferase